MALQFHKDVVVILSFDVDHQLWHTTTFGQTVHHKVLKMANQPTSTRVSAGCDHCYAVLMTHRMERPT